MGESGSYVYYFVPEPINFVEVTRLSANIRKPWLKATVKQINNLINNKTLLVDENEKGEPKTPCMDVYKSKIQYYGSLDELKVIGVVRGYLHIKDLIGDT